MARGTGGAAAPPSAAPKKRRRRASRPGGGGGPGGPVDPGFRRGGQQRRRRQGNRPLTPKQKRRRRTRRLDQTLYNPVSVLSGKDLRRSLNQLVRGEIRPEVEEIDRQIVRNREQGAQLSGRAGGYFQQLANEEAQSVATQKAITDRLNASLAGIGQETQQRLDQAGADAKAGLAADEQLRGEGLSGGAEEMLARELQAQKAREAAQAQTFRSSGAAQGAGFEQLQAAMRGANAARGADVQAQIAQRQQMVDQDLRGRRRDVVASKGPLRTKLLLQLREAGFEQLATQLGLDLEGEQLRAEIADQRRDARIDRERIATTRRGQDIASEDRRRGQDVTKRGQDIISRDKRLDRQLRRDLAEMEEDGGGGGAKEWSEGAKNRWAVVLNLAATSNPRKRKKFPPLARRAAWELKQGGLTEGTFRALREANVAVPRKYRPYRHPTRT